jgi:hypothetical protein
VHDETAALINRLIILLSIDKARYFVLFDLILSHFGHGKRSISEADTLQSSFIDYMKHVIRSGNIGSGSIGPWGEC